MNPQVKVEFDMPDPSASPVNLTQLYQLNNFLVRGEIMGSYIPYVVQNGTPGADDHDKAWLQLDTGGRPIALKYFYNGSWRRVYNGMLGEVRGYSGDPNNDFDVDGLGKVGLEYDGWHLCNGKDGTPDLSDRFLIAAHMNNVETQGFQDGEWITTQIKTSGDHEGGFREITLNPKNIFETAGNIGTVTVGKYTIAGATLDVNGIIWGKPSEETETKNLDLNVVSPGSQTPEAINIINPFIAMGYIIFVGYN